MELVIIAIIGLALGLVPGLIAQSKGRSFLPWWLYGAALFIVALPHAIMLGPRNACPACREPIRMFASVCPHCQTEIDWDLNEQPFVIQAD